MSKDQQNSVCPRMKDLKYFVIFIIVILGIIGFAIYQVDFNMLYELSLPRDTKGKVCPPESPNLIIEGPSIANRSCSSQQCFKEEQNLEGYPIQIDKLDGLCLSSQQTKQILLQRGQYQQYIEPKLQALNNYRIIFTVYLICVAISFVYYLLQRVASCFQNNMNLIENVTIGIALLAGIFVIWTLYHLNLPLFITATVLLSLYIIYVILWKIIRKQYTSSKNIDENNYLQRIQGQISNENTVKCCQSGTILQEILLPFITVLSVFFICLTMFIHLCTLSPPTFSYPEVYATSNEFTVFTCICIILFVYFYCFCASLGEYMVAQGVIGGQEGFMGVLCRVGSVCKLAFIKMLFWAPSSFLVFIKPVEGEKLASACHCLCGYLLNMSHRYFLPVPAYQLVSGRLGLGQAATKLHYETHINKVQFFGGNLQIISCKIIIAAIAFVSTKMLSQPLQIYPLTGVLSVVGSVFICEFFITAASHRANAEQVKNLCGGKA